MIAVSVVVVVVSGCVWGEMLSTASDGRETSSSSLIVRQPGQVVCVRSKAAVLAKVANNLPLELRDSSAVVLTRTSRYRD